MSSAPVVGGSYARLSATDYETLRDYFAEYPALIALLEDFNLGVDGYYYADPESIDTEEQDLLLELGLDLENYNYIYSTWYTGNM